MLCPIWSAKLVIIDSIAVVFTSGSILLERTNVFFVSSLGVELRFRDYHFETESIYGVGRGESLSHSAFLRL
jgi:hypothetical protein